MSRSAAKSKNGQKEKHTQELPKTLTGIQGLDEITRGGLPRGRPTLICGSAGCGKTLLAMEFLIRGAQEFNEPGVFFAFEESPEELATNVRSLGADVNGLVKRGKLKVEYIHVDRNEIRETGEFDLEGLFIRLGYAIDTIKAKRVVLDTIEYLFDGIENKAILRSELRRLFRWLKDKGVTTLITGERGEGQLTRQGLEEYVSDCVILLDHRVADQLSTRRLRIVKYRGTLHGTNEYPFIIDAKGISVLPITSLSMDHDVSTERISTGVPGLDEMLGGKGIYRGSHVLVSGTAGVGKTSFAAHFARSTCQRGERCLYFSFEEPERQLARNMKSIGIDLDLYLRKGLLKIHSSRPSLLGLESHLVHIHKLVNEFAPDAVIVDPITSFTASSSALDIQALLLRLMDFLRGRGTTTFLTSLTTPGTSLERTEVFISSMIDTWFLLRDIELAGERNRGVYVLKSRGMAHSHQIREYQLSPRGIELIKAYIGPEGVLTGSMRASQEARELAEMSMRRQQKERKIRELARRKLALAAELDAIADETKIIEEQERVSEMLVEKSRAEMALRRGGDGDERAKKT